MRQRGDRVDPPVRLMTVLGLVGLLVIVGATVVFAVSWPAAPVRSPQFPVSFFAYDPATGLTSGIPSTTFHEGQIPAARVDLTSLSDLPSGAVNAAWYDSLGFRTNRVDRSHLRELTEPVPLSTTSAVPRGGYQFVLSVTSPAGTTEVLAWTQVAIER